MNTRDDVHCLALEVLENRMMLSSVQVVAFGELGDESFDLVIDSQPVATFSNIGTQVQVFEFESLEPVTADQIQIQFTNDLYDPENGIDRNLYVDKIVIDGTDFQTEAPSTLSTGTWTPTAGIVPGYLQTEVLHTDGYFQFATALTTLTIRASGDVGTEVLELQIDDQTVMTFEVAEDFQEFVYVANSQVDLERVKIVFSGDVFDPVSGQDTNLNVDWIQIDESRVETDSPFVFSSATWTPEDGIQPGLGRGETLHTNGFFRYGLGSTVSIAAAGDEGTESFDLQIDGQTVKTYQVGLAESVFEFDAVGLISSDQVRIVFSGDVFDASTQIDTNLFVNWIEIDGQRISANESSVFSTGTWTPEDGIVPGFGRGNRLHTDGYFQFGAMNLSDDLFSLPEDSTRVPLAVLSNDEMGLEVELQIAAYSLPSQGTLVLENGTLFYTPNPDYAGVDQFTYTVMVGDIESDPVTVELVVNPSHEQPQTLINSEIAPEIDPSGLFLEVKKLVQIPLGANGRQPRLNAMAFSGDRVFVAADGGIVNEGQIYELIDIDGVVTAQLFLDVGAAVVANTGRNLDNTSPQGGLRSIAFHPEFATNGKFYTSILEERPLDLTGHTYLSDAVTSVGVDSVVVEWTLDELTGWVDPTSYREVFRVGMHVYDHPIKGIAFDQHAEAGDENFGLLFIGHGDGSVQSAIAGDGQNNDALGKVLRVNPLENGLQSFSIPDTNPFVDDPTMLDAAYAIGFRNPHNLTFALDANGVSRLVVTEIGRDNLDEINVVTKGANYGWAEREGPLLHAKSESGGINVGLSNLPADEALNGYVFPVAFLGHEGEIGDTFVAQAIAGGHVIQNGSSELDDQFVFVEFATEGRAYHVDFSEMLEQVTLLDPNDPAIDSPDDLTWITPQELTILFDHDNDDSTTPLIRDSLKDVLDDEPDFESIISADKTRADLRLGAGPNGELYILNKRNGWIYIATNTVAPAPVVEE